MFRAVNKGGRVYGEGLTANVIWSVVQAYAAELGVPRLAPHDLRRTCAKLCRAAGGDLEQIQLLLGHASIQTTALSRHTPEPHPGRQRSPRTGPKRRRRST